MYANRQVSSESLHYATVMFPQRAGSDIEGLTKVRDTEELKHADGAEVLYAQVKPRKR